jgi:hypothetical protein
MRDIEPDPTFRPPAWGALDVHLSSSHPHPLVDAPQPEAVIVLTHLLDFEPLAIIRDRQQDCVPGAAQGDVDAGRGGMLRDVAQRFRP